MTDGDDPFSYRTDGGGSLGSDPGGEGPFRSVPDGDDPFTPAEAGRSDLDDRHIEQFQSAFGRVRTALKRREHRFRAYQRRLNQARLGTTYDEYLATVIDRTLVGAVLGVVVGALLGITLVYTSGGSESAVADGGATAAVVLWAVVFGLLAGGSTLGVGYYYPVWVARTRRARIERQLPHGVAYLYALSHGGLDVVEAVRALAEAEEEYGELSREFDAAVREMAYLGADPLGGIRSLRDRTPSSQLANFLDDLASSIDAGGDVTALLATQTDDQYERGRREQSAFLETISLYAELYVGLLVVGPIFAIIVLVMITLTGPTAVRPLLLVVYVFVPAATLGFLQLLRSLTAEFESVTRTPESQEPAPIPGGVENDPRLEAYHEHRRRDRLQEFLDAPIQWFFGRPERSLFVSVPLAGAFVLAVLVSGLVTPSFDYLFADPLGTTMLLGVVPFVVLVVPFAILHEYRIARIRAIVDNFPNTLAQLSSANEQGLTMAEAFDVVARRTGGPLGEELQQTANDMHWGLGTEEALERFRDRVPTDVVARTLSLLSDASRYSGDLHLVIDVAARDSKNARALELDRRSEMATYVAIVLISFLLYLLMIVVLEGVFLEQVTQLPPVELPEGFARQDPISPLDQGIYQAVLFHAALIQGVCAGLVAGELGEDSWRSGLKYSLGMVLVTVLAFVYVTVSGGIVI